MSLKDIQKAFQAAVYGENPDLLANLAVGPQGATTLDAIEAYRHNTLERLRRVLGQAYPVLKCLIGEPLFHQLATLYVQANPSRSQALHKYGAGFEETVRQVQKNQESLSAVPYLADVAVLEWHMHTIYYAKDRQGFNFDMFGQLQEDDYQRVVLQIAPDIGLVQVGWPVADIWYMHQPGQQLSALDMQPRPHSLLVERPGNRPKITEIGEQTRRALQLIGEGYTLAELVGMDEAIEPIMANCLQAGWIDGFTLA
jgi:hypothetical protein